MMVDVNGEVGEVIIEKESQHLERVIKFQG